MRANAVAAVVALVAAPALADQVFSDALVQAPSLDKPERGSLAGQLARDVLSAADLARGTVELPSPFVMPSDRGALLVSPFPSYASDAGLSEWGLGWRSDIVIRRTRLIGHVNYVDDELSGPWGRLQRGTDGAWYPVGLRTAVRVVESDDRLVALLADGASWSFGQRTRERTAEGTYAWYLDEVRTIDGQVTRLAYEADGGRPWLTDVWWGGVEEPAHHAHLSYEPIAVASVTLRSGEPVSLSRRVRAIEVRSRNERTRQLMPRWSYSLDYAQDEIGPAFYLVRVQRRFASGEDDTPLAYEYLRPAEVLGAARLVEVAARGALDAAVVRPDRSQPIDIDDDGLLDLEVAEDFSLLRQRREDFVRETQVAAGSVDRRCRPEDARDNHPRVLARVRGPRAPVEVVSLRGLAAGQRTELRLCDRAGHLRVREELGGSWAPDALTRLVDMDGDEHPDLVRINAGSIVVRKNRRGAPGPLFAAPERTSITPVVQPETAWIQDWNGDGIADVVVRNTHRLLVWLGAGRGRIAPAGIGVSLATSAGLFPSIEGYQLSFVDVNRDGLADVILTRAQRALLFVNDGKTLRSHALPALAGLDWTAGAPQVADLTGSGETELALAGGGRLRALALTAPGVALVRAADDGRGARLSFTYARAEPAAGVGRRQVVLARVISALGGERPQTHDFTVSGPRVHSEGRFFIGFDMARRTGPDGWDEARFANTDEASGVLVATLAHDQRAPELDVVRGWTLERALFRGVPVVRCASTTDGHVVAATGTPVPGPVTRYRYEGLCPRVVEQQLGRDRLETTSSRATPAALDGHLHCLEDSRVLRGWHRRSALDFTLRLRVERNERGSPLSLWIGGGGRELPLQRIRYDAFQSPVSISTSATGTTTFTWSAPDHQLERVTSHDGVMTRVSARDPVTGALLGLDVERGGERFHSGFRYDGQERLAASWDNAGGSDAEYPDVTFGYAYPGPDRPGWWHVRRSVDRASGSTEEVFELAGPRGTTLTTLTRLASGWSFAPVALAERGRTRTLLHPPLGVSASPDQLGYADLEREGELVAESLHAGAAPVMERTLFHAGVEKRVTHRHRSAGGHRVHVAVEGDGEAIEREFDEAGRVVRRSDPNGATYRYAYDALGRLREVVLPLGSTAEVDYDALARVSRIRWRRLGSVSYAYDPRSGLRVEETWRGTDGVARRRVSLEHDGAGRVIVRRAVDLQSGKSETFSYRYDRQSDDLGGQGAIGLLTEIRGPRLRKAFDYSPDGLVRRQITEIDGWGRLESAFTRFDDGRPKTRRTTFSPADGSSAAVQTLTWRVDPHGRTVALRVGEVTELALVEDAWGDPAEAAVAGWKVQVERDPLTRLPIALDMRRNGTRFRTDVRLGARGAPVEERVALDGATQRVTYDYGPGGFIRTASSAAVRAYAYRSDGLLIPANAPALERDGLGRVTRKGDVRYRYGPGGSLEEATSPAGTWLYLYDEQGQRLLRQSGHHAVVEADGVVVDGGTIISPATLGARRLGVFAGSQFIAEFDDARGSQRVGARTDLRELGPYGEAFEHLDRADYHGRPWDAGAQAIRFGSRDYAPELGAFLTPDLAFFTDPSRCVDSPVECNLYGFARGMPSAFTDPTGNESSIFPVSQLADATERNRDDYRAWLADQLTPSTGSAEAAGLAALTLSVEMGVGLADMLRLGEGVAAGTARGYAEDALRTVAVVTTVVRAVKAVRGAFTSLAGSSEEATAARAPPGPPELPAYDGKTTQGVYMPDEGGSIPLGSGSADPQFKNYVAASHVEGKAAVLARQSGSQGGTVYHNNPNGTCGYCDAQIETLLPEGSKLRVVPPANAVPNNTRAVAVPKTYTGNSATPKPPK